MDWLVNLFKGMDAKDWGAVLGGVGNAYAAYEQGKAAKDLLKMQKDDYYDERRRRKQFQSRLDKAAEANLGTVALPL